MARKKPHPEHENLERWLVSYADFITLLFAFFVVMYALNQQNEGKYKVFADSILQAFRVSERSIRPIQIGNISKSQYTVSFLPNNPASHNTQLADAQASQGNRQEGDEHAQAMNTMAQKIETASAMKEIAEEVEKTFAHLVKSGIVRLRRSKEWVEIEIKAGALFPPGSAQIDKDAIPVLKKLADILGKFQFPIRVEGHTDNAIIKTDLYPSNWELSSARSASVIRLFEGRSVDPKRMESVGYGENRPITDNDTEEGRSNNRRVVIAVFSGKDRTKELMAVGQGKLEGDFKAPPPPPPPPPGSPQPEAWPPKDITDQTGVSQGVFHIIPGLTHYSTETTYHRQSDATTGGALPMPSPPLPAVPPSGGMTSSPAGKPSGDRGAR